MKHIMICVLLAAAVCLGGCMGSSIYRGLDANSGAFVSTHAPTVSVIPAEGYENVLTGYTLCRVPYENSFISTFSSNVWFSLQKREGSQLVTVLAECPADVIWEVRGIGVDFQVLDVFYEKNGVAPSDATVRVYVRPASMDPWTPLYAGAGKAEWEGSTLVARYEWNSSTDREKLIVEYREPAPEFLDGMNPRMTDLAKFIERSQKAFTLGGVTLPVTPVSGSVVPVPDRTLAPVIGSVTSNPVFLF